jgi:ferredoxin
MPMGGVKNGGRSRGSRVRGHPGGGDSVAPPPTARPITSSHTKELIQTNVIGVEDESIYVASRKRGFDRVGKYACDCGEGCNCGTIS